MLVLITYDVRTDTPEGKTRLRRVAKACVDYGQRVQNSVFECLLDQTQLKQMEKRLLDIIDLKSDSLRFYRLGNNYENKISHFGVKPAYLPEGTLLL